MFYLKIVGTSSFYTYASTTMPNRHALGEYVAHQVTELPKDAAPLLKDQSAEGRAKVDVMTSAVVFLGTYTVYNRERFDESAHGVGYMDMRRSFLHMQTLQNIVENAKRPEDPDFGTIHRELSDRGRAIAQTIRDFKAVQWRIVNYNLLLDAALLGITRIVFQLEMPESSRFWTAGIVGLLLLVLMVVALSMLVKTEDDLGYYRAHAQLNEVLLDRATGIVGNANGYVTSIDAGLRGRDDFGASSAANTRVFTIPMFLIVLLAALLSSVFVVVLLKCA